MRFLGNKMKKILIVYGLLSLLLLAVLSVLSYGAGLGYVYVLWRGVQVQTNIWFISFFLIFLGLILQIAWLFIKRNLIRGQRQADQVVDFNALHTYEQLGVAWILESEAQQKDYIQPVFEQSGLLKQIVQARILYKQCTFEQALLVLQDAPPAAFELAEIQRIEIYIANNDPVQALTHLEFLNGHELSPWLKHEEEIYNQRIKKLWGIFAVQYPWQYLRSTEYGHLDMLDKQQWLSQLLIQFENATVEDIQLLIERYTLQEEYIQTLDFESRVLWLKVLFRIPEMAEQHGILALQLLDERFDQDVFYLWFQQQLLKQNPDYNHVEKHILQLDAKYPSMPIFAFAHWHVYKATQRNFEAEQLLCLYPDNILMNYLRIKSTFEGDEDMIQQLNSVFEKDMNFLPIKI